jgi:regulator of protease activity HflC (stomatin/prohibitin superfamily)
MRRRCGTSWMVLAGATTLLPACGAEVLEPGHRGLRFDPYSDGLKHEILQPGRHGLGWCFLRDCGRIDDFDVTYSSRHEKLSTSSQEGLTMQVQLSVIFRPIVAELYELDSEVGPTYYEEVVGPEFRSAARGVFARHSYTELASKNEKIEDEIEQQVRRRIHGKHVEVASVTIESVGYAPEIANALRAKIVGEQEAVRQKAGLENDALRQKLMLEQTAAQNKLKLESDFEQAKRKTEIELLQKKNDRAVAEENAQLEKVRAQGETEALLLRAKAEAQQTTILAKAHAEENRAQTQTLSPLTVQMAAYEALGKLGGTNTTILLGDWSHVPGFLFPHGTPGYLTVPTPTFGGAAGGKR